MLLPLKDAGSQQPGRENEVKFADGKKTEQPRKERASRDTDTRTQHNRGSCEDSGERVERRGALSDNNANNSTELETKQHTRETRRES